MKNHKRTLREKAKQLLILIGICCIPLFVVTGCGMAKSFSCQWCGSSSTYTPVFASGVETGTNIEYQSCVCPAGCLGIGLNTKCWPTECLYVKVQGEDSSMLSGTVCYYDGLGCIGKNPLSAGNYSESTNIGCISCSTGVYEENVNSDKSQGYSSDSCLGVNYNRQPSEFRDLNNNMPRQFRYGCYTPFRQKEE